MASNPFSGSVPLNRRVDNDKIKKQTSFISGETHPLEYRNQHNDKTVLPVRNEGCTMLRRYPNGLLDFDYVKHQIVDVLHKLQDGGFVTEMEKAVLALVLPNEFGTLIDKKIAATMARVSTQEKEMLKTLVMQHLQVAANYNTGRGGGFVDGRTSAKG